MGHCNRDLHVGAQLQLADADLLTEIIVAYTVDERCRAILDLTRISVWDQARVGLPVQQCNLSLHPQLR